ncbi:MAG: PAS domain S-box protein [Sandaracinaceae bacterium]|nr:PAS domain S-box protein [Sandaracinaceae bacterium]
MSLPDAVRALMIDGAFEAIAILEDGVIVWTNEAFCALFGVPREAVVGRSPLEFAAPEDHARIAAAVRSGSTEPYEATGLRADGSRFRGELRGRSVTVADGAYRITSIRDLTERVAMEEDLRRSEARYRELFDAAADGLLVMDLQALPTQTNRRLCDMLGRTREEILAMRPEEAIADLDIKPMRLDRLEHRKSYVVERELFHADGRRVAVEVNLTAIGGGEVLAVIRDVRERREAEAQAAALRDRLQQAQSLAALGRLAGGVAHDFNNLLTVILAAADHLQRSDTGRPHVDGIVTAATRAAELTGHLLTFSQTRPRPAQRIDAAAQVADLVPLMRRLLGDEHPLELTIEATPLLLVADPGQLTQVLMNLVLNAREAMPGGGAIRVVLGADADRLRIEVRDEGVGIDDAVREHLFEPFFTTKQASGNSGLGLSTVYGIVASLGGEITVDSDPSGSCFTVRLSLAPSAPDDEPPKGEPGRALRVLLVEDEPAVRRAVGRMLVACGHSTLEAGGVAEALALIDGGAEFDVLLSDVVMPDGTGVTLAERVGADRTVLMSGYPKSYVSDRQDLKLLAKPFTVVELLQALAEAVD